MDEKKKVNTGIDYKNSKWRPGIFIDADKREPIERWFTGKGYRSFNEYVIALIDQDIKGSNQDSDQADPAGANKDCES